MEQGAAPPPARPTADETVAWATSDLRLIRRMLALTPEQRLQGLAGAAAFFAAARRG